MVYMFGTSGTTSSDCWIRFTANNGTDFCSQLLTLETLIVELLSYAMDTFDISETEHIGRGHRSSFVTWIAIILYNNASLKIAIILYLFKQANHRIRKSYWWDNYVLCIKNESLKIAIYKWIDRIIKQKIKLINLLLSWLKYWLTHFQNRPTIKLTDWRNQMNLIPDIHDKSYKYL